MLYFCSYEDPKAQAEKNRKKIEDRVLYIIQGNVDRADWAVNQDAKNYKDTFFLVTGSSLMKDVSVENSEARNIKKYLENAGVESSRIFESPKGQERMGNFFYMRDSLDKILKNENIIDIKMPIQSLYAISYKLLSNKINQDILGDKKIVPAVQYRLKSGSRYIEGVVDWAINSDIKNGLVDLNNIDSVGEYVQRIEDAKDSFGGFVKTSSGIFIPKKSKYEMIASGYKTFLIK